MKSCSSNPAGWCRHVFFLALVLLSIPAPAVEVPSLYTAEVPFDRDASDPRADAYETALKEILMRVSGSDLACNAAAVEELFPNPASYVMQFRPGADDTLWVSFDGQAIEQTLRNAGQTVWGADRPLTLVWLAVDWGQGEREIVGPTIRTGPRANPVRSIVIDSCASACWILRSAAACRWCFRCSTRRICRLSPSRISGVASTR